tara:strand:+ start:42 stop:578 length:537 start_codon:yes stop_codon:yes gene_type:complete
MCKKTRTTPEQALDGVAALGNANHWTSWLNHLEERMNTESESKKPLSDAATYVAWLLLSSEHVFYSLRWFLYVDSGLQNGAVFNNQYKPLLSAVTPRMPPKVAADAVFAVRVRHILVHKGFPNPQNAPTRRGGEFSEEDVWEVRGKIASPSNYQEIKGRLDSVLRWIAQNTPDVEFEL